MKALAECGNTRILDGGDKWIIADSLTGERDRIPKASFPWFPVAAVAKWGFRPLPGYEEAARKIREEAEG